MNTKASFEDQVRSALERQADGVQPEPLPGHEERFETKLLQLREAHKVKKFPGRIVIALAAACLAGLIITVIASQIKKDELVAETAKLSDVSYEMARVEEFFTERIRTETPVAGNSDSTFLRFQSRLQQMEKEYVKLEKVLAQNFSNQRVIDAMVANYRYRLQIIEMMQKYIEIKNQQNDTKNETSLSS